MPDLMRNILMQLLKSLFKRELERQSADHFQQCLMAISNVQKRKRIGLKNFD